MLFFKKIAIPLTYFPGGTDWEHANFIHNKAFYYGALLDMNCAVI